MQDNSKSSTVWIKKFYPLSFSENFSQRLRIFQSKFYTYYIILQGVIKKFSAWQWRTTRRISITNFFYQLTSLHNHREYQYIFANASRAVLDHVRRTPYLGHVATCPQHSWRHHHGQKLGHECFLSASEIDKSLTVLNPANRKGAATVQSRIASQTQQRRVSCGLARCRAEEGHHSAACHDVYLWCISQLQ